MKGICGLVLFQWSIKLYLIDVFNLFSLRSKCQIFKFLFSNTYKVRIDWETKLFVAKFHKKDFKNIFQNNIKVEIKIRSDRGLLLNSFEKQRLED